LKLVSYYNTLRISGGKIGYEFQERKDGE
jgi:hypothetical protein